MQQQAKALYRMREAPTVQHRTPPHCTVCTLDAFPSFHAFGFGFHCERGASSSKAEKPVEFMP